MSLLRILIAILFVVLGVAIGALNPQHVALDFGFTAIDAGLGVMVLGALLAGAVCGGLFLALSVIVPLQRALRRERARNAAASSSIDSGA